MTEAEGWLAVSLVSGLGGRTGKALLEAFGTSDRILGAENKDLEAVPGVGPKLSAAIRRGPDRERLRDEFSLIERAGATIVGLSEEGYPSFLREIPDPPLVLYLLGRPLEPDRPRVAMVGSRASSDSGRAVARELARDLSSSGIEIVSGMARGIDSASHLGALEGGGTTVAVLGCGIDVLYPFRGRELRDRISKDGSLVSEFPMRAPPIAEYFPRRNRIISGLSMAVIVVEAAERSGALLTAEFALEQGRDVFAVPGSPKSRLAVGPNRLIQDGAKLVMSSEDVFEELVLPGEMLSGHGGEPPRPEAQDPVETGVLRAVRSGAGLVDEIAERAGHPVSVVLERLLTMELRGLVKRTGGARYEQVEP